MSDTKVVKLDQVIKHGNTEIEEVTVRKPSSGELRGVSLMELAQMDVGALQKVIPRVTTPSLLEQDVTAMDPADLMQIGVILASFLLKKSERESLAT